MGRKQLAKIDSIVDERNQVRDAYRSLLEPMGFLPQRVNADVRFNVQSLVFSVPPDCNRNRLIAGLKASGIESTIGTYAMSASTYYARKYAVQNTNSHWLEENTLTLPCYGGVDISRVCAAIKGGLCR
jgi:dTDP-4-amino-4,6-dideoxygalactose transaminase